MRILLLILTLSLSNSILGQYNPISIHRIYGGIGYLKMVENVRLFQFGYNNSGIEHPFIFGIENGIYFDRKNYDWPGIGTYTYQRIINVSSVNFGIQVARRRRFNPYLGMCYNYAIYKGKLITTDPLLKTYLLNDYRYEKFNFFFLLKLNYRVTKRIGIYLSFNSTSIKKDLPKQFYGSIGLTYHLYNKR